MAHKTIGKLYAEQGARFFLCYCSHCRESVYWSSDEAKEFLENASKYVYIKHSFFKKITLPKIRVKWGSEDNLTGVVESNNISNMARLKQKSQMTERTKKILEERSTGKSIVELGKIYNVSRQRVYQILKDYGDTLPKELHQQ